MSAKRRIFARRRSHFAWKLLIAAIAVTTALAACTNRTAHWSPAQTPKKNKVTWVSHSLVVHPARSGKALSTGERERLDRFASEIALGYGDQVVIKTGRAQLARTADTLAHYFRTRRLNPKIEIVDAVRDSVIVSVGRYVVTPPKCPDWSKPAGTDPNNRISSNFGCATTTNLGLMLADPGDLVRGRPKGPSDGDAAARLVRKYRLGKVKEPAKVSAGPTLSGLGQ